jgi:hypothetical protein
MNLDPGSKTARMTESKTLLESLPPDLIRGPDDGIKEENAKPMNSLFEIR